MNIVKKFSLVVAMCLVATSVIWASSPQSVKIYATDHVGLDSAVIGIHPLATGQIDVALGEYELPPNTPTTDFRCFDMPGWDTLGYGAKINYHKMVSESQTDTFRFQFKSDQYGDNMTFSWPPDMKHVYGGFWLLLDDSNHVVCDMTQNSSYTFPTFSSLIPQYIRIVKGDGLGFLTATWLDLANAVDSKSKGAGEKRKNIASEGMFNFTSPATYPGWGVAKLYVEFSQAVSIISKTPFDAIEDIAGAHKKFNLSFTAGDTLLPSTVVSIFAQGNKGKQLTVKSYWWIPDSLPLKWKATKLGPVVPAGPSDRLRLNMPNWNNIGEELYTENAFPDELNVGLYLGVGVHGETIKHIPIIVRAIYPKKYSAVYKSLNNKGTKHDGGPAACLVPYPVGTVGKWLTKDQKGYDPVKSKNELVAALIALKFNIASSHYLHTEAGFGGLQYKAQVGDPSYIDGTKLDDIVIYADNFMSCFTTYARAPGDTITLVGADLLKIINTVNSTFAGTFDTVSFGAKTVVKTVRQLINTKNLLYRSTLAVAAPVITPGYKYAETTPVEFKLNQNYPNPFNPTTTISFDLSADAFVSLKVYNMLGQEVATLADHQEFTSGTNDVTFDASGFASGVYYYRVIVNDGEQVQVKKMMLLK